MGRGAVAIGAVPSEHIDLKVLPEFVFIFIELVQQIGLDRDDERDVAVRAEVEYSIGKTILTEKDSQRFSLTCHILLYGACGGQTRHDEYKKY